MCMAWQPLRVNALKQHFKKESTLKNCLNRHEIYAHLARKEPDVWALCGTEEQRERAVKKPTNGTRPHSSIVDAWNEALKEAFNVELFHNTGSRGGQPNGYWTKELSIIPRSS